MAGDKVTTGKAPAANDVKGASEIMDSKMSGGRYSGKTRKHKKHAKKHAKKHGGKSRTHKKQKHRQNPTRSTANTLDRKPASMLDRRNTRRRVVP